jgi:hypothetical protein
VRVINQHRGKNSYQTLAGPHVKLRGRIRMILKKQVVKCLTNSTGSGQAPVVDDKVKLSLQQAVEDHWVVRRRCF